MAGTAGPKSDWNRMARASLALILPLISAALLVAQAQPSSQSATPSTQESAATKPTVPATQKSPDGNGLAGVTSEGTQPAAAGDTPKLSPEKQKAKDQLAKDTARLYELANELKAEMDKSTKDTLSLSVIRKADEVEKLAKKVHAEMKANFDN